MNTYTVRALATGYRVVKFDELFNVEAIYYVRGNIASRLHCDCWQKDRYSCRHREMVVLFHRYQRLSKGYFYNWDARTWELPVSDAFKCIKAKLTKLSSSHV